MKVDWKKPSGETVTASIPYDWSRPIFQLMKRRNGWTNISISVDGVEHSVSFKQVFYPKGTEEVIGDRQP